MILLILEEEWDLFFTCAECGVDFFLALNNSNARLTQVDVVSDPQTNVFIRLSGV